MAPTVVKLCYLLLSNDGTYCCQTMIPTVVKRWHLLLSNYGTYCCQTMVPTVVKRWYLLLSNDGTYCCQTMVPTVVKQWYLLLSNDGTYCCQTPVIRKGTKIEDFMFSCHWNTFVGQYVYLDNETRSMHHPSHESYVTYFANTYGSVQ